MLKVEKYRCDTCGKEFDTEEECRRHEDFELVRLTVRWAPRTTKVEFECSHFCYPEDVIAKYLDVVRAGSGLSPRHVHLTLKYSDPNCIEFSIDATHAMKEEATRFLVKYVKELLDDMHANVDDLYHKYCDAEYEDDGLFGKCMKWMRRVLFHVRGPEEE